MQLSNPAPSTTAAAISAAATTIIGYLAGIGYDLTQIDWPLAIGWLTTITGAGGAIGYATSDKSKPDIVENDGRPLGIRNNNPGNIRPLDRGTWMGETGSNSGFSTFSEPLYGLRAMARNLKNQKRLHKIDNLHDLIYKYAPPIENDTDAYIGFVSAKTGIDQHAVIDFEDSMILLPVMRAMIKMENGQNPYSNELIQQAIGIA